MRLRNLMSRENIPVASAEFHIYSRDMEDWKTKLKPEEAERYEQLKLLTEANIKERGRIYDRCRKRLRKDVRA